MGKDPNDFWNQIYSQDQNPDSSSGSIQWKGTDVCMDVECE